MGKIIIKSYINEYYYDIKSILYKSDIIKYYPDFNKWLKKIKLENRHILLIRNRTNIIGFAILKKNKKYTKVCTFFICKKYRNKNLGTKLLKFILKENNNIKMTIPEELFRIYNKILYKEKDYMKFTITKELGKYRKNKYEYILNI